MTTPSPRPGPDLDALLATLPRSVAPSRDLWPPIAAALAPPARPRRWPQALAAGLALVTLGVLVARHTTPPATVLATSTPTAAPALRAVELKETEFRETRTALLGTYEERIRLLSPTTRARIAADLATIRRAQQDLREALASDPGSRVLLRLYESATQQEFDLYTTVGRNTEPAAARTRT